MQCLSRGCSTTTLPYVAEFSRGNQDATGEESDSDASRLIKYATIISVPTEARSPFPSLRDAAKRSLFGCTTREEQSCESGEFSARKLVRRGGARYLIPR